MEVIAFYPCEATIQRWSGAIDVMNLGIRGGLTIEPGPLGYYWNCTVLIWIRFDADETQAPAIQVELIDADAQFRHNPPGIVATLGPEREMIWGLPFAAQLPHAGDYELLLRINQRVERRYPLRIAFRPATGAASAPAPEPP